MNLVTSALTPAEMLLGIELDNGWTVVENVNKKAGATGGRFSVGYKVRHKDGREGFLKAIDFSDALSSPDPARALQETTETFNFERDLLDKCRKKNFDRVVRIYEEGKVVVSGMAVQYMIFELAAGDMRAQIDLSSKIDLVWTLRMLHHVTVGLKQLHSINIAHQDIKPSNVVVFENLISKLADLGRSNHPDFDPPHRANVFAGAWPYAPPELRYGFTDPDENKRRFGADLYLLGNIVLFAFTRETMANLLFLFLEPQYMPYINGNSYHAVLPYLQNAFNEALQRVRPLIPLEARDEIILSLRYLCEPDLERRGHPRNRGSRSLERFIETFNQLAYKAERGLFTLRGNKR